MVAGDRVAQRRWRILLMLATHGSWYTTADVQALIGMSPVTVHRDLTAMVKANLVQRRTIDEDRSHRWIYAATDAGERRVAEVLQKAGLDVPANLGLWAGAQATRLLVLLSAASQFEGVGRVLDWRSGADAAWWLRRAHGIDGVQVDAFGVWAQGNRAIRFLVQVDDHPMRQVVDRLLDQLAAPVSLRLPVQAVLVIAGTDADEQFIHGRLRESGPAVVVATTTQARLYGPDGPTGPIWSTFDNPLRLCLIELTQVPPGSLRHDETRGT